MDSYDFVIIGAGPAGEAATHKARQLGASVAVIDRDLFGGSCPYWGCVPSKSLLNSAARHLCGDDPWQRASDRRDYMIDREHRDYPDDSGHVRSLEKAGATVLRGEGRLDGPGRVVVTHEGSSVTVGARVAVVIGVGSTTAPARKVEDIDTVRIWSNVDATGARELPRSLLVLGGGPTGVELAQVYARFGVPTTIVQSGPRLIPRDHPRNAEAALKALQRDGVDVRLGVRAQRARAGTGTDGADVIELDDGTSAQGHAILLAIGRESPLAPLGLETVGLDPAQEERKRDGRLRIADGVYLIGDPAGPELHTHQGHYQGEIAVRMALGEDVKPDYRALPRATYTDPELAFVGLTLDEATEKGLDAFELVADFPKTTKGYSVEAVFGHVTIVVDRATRELVGAAMATPDASAAIHECVLAIKARVKMEVLAETIHAFPSTSRIFNGLFADAARKLAAS